MEANINKLTEILLETVIQVKGGIEKGINVAYQQIPDIINQLITFHLYWNIFVLFCFFSFFSLVIYLNYKQYKWWTTKVTIDKETYLNTSAKKEGTGTRWNMYNNQIVYFNLFQLLFLFLLIPLFITIKETLYILVAPKLFLIEYISNLVK